MANELGKMTFTTRVEVGSYVRPNGQQARGEITEREDGELFVSIHPFVEGNRGWFPSRWGMGSLSFDEVDDYHKLLTECKKAKNKYLKERAQADAAAEPEGD